MLVQLVRVSVCTSAALFTRFCRLWTPHVHSVSPLDISPVSLGARNSQYTRVAVSVLGLQARACLVR
jgi:hypothetical protein